MSTTAIYTKSACPLCGRPIAPGCERAVCSHCRTVHHRACWHEHHGCANPACSGQEALPLPLLSGREQQAGVAPTPRAVRRVPLNISTVFIGLAVLFIVLAFIAHACGVRTNLLLVLSVVVTARIVS